MPDQPTVTGDGIPNTSPLRQAAWYCTYCGAQHQPDQGTLIDARYALGLCSGTPRALTRDQDRAIHLANVGGKFRPKGTALGTGFQVGPAPVAKPGETKRVQDGQA